jgi:hypothetical protein
MHHDALRSTYASRPGTGAVAFAFGHSWVVLALIVTPPWSTSRSFAIPFLFRLYRPKKRTPASQYRKRTELAADLVRILLETLPEDRTLHLVGDAEYACKTLVRSLPSNVHFTGPLPKDAALYEAPETYRGRGRPPKRGRRLPSPKALAEERSSRWRRCDVHIYGRDVAIQTKAILGRWASVTGERDVRIVLTRDPSGRLADRAYFCTDAQRTVEDVICTYAMRWEIEVAFRNTKQTLGLQDAQNGWWRRPSGTRRPRKRAGPNPKGVRGQRAAEHTLPFAFSAYAIVLLWYFQCGAPARDVDRSRREAPWYAHKAEPSFADMLVGFRRAIWRRRLSLLPQSKLDPAKSHPLLAGWMLAA